MSRVKSQDTKPEKIVRSFLHRLGYRFRLQKKDLPGTPDIILPKYKIAIFVHGCFWHRHPNCKRARMPASNIDYWQNKFEKNISRDVRNIALLEQDGWHVLVLWECEVTQPQSLQNKLTDFLTIHGKPKNESSIESSTV